MEVRNLAAAREWLIDRIAERAVELFEQEREQESDSRLGRTSETHAIVADLEDLEVEVISVTEGKEKLSRGIQLVVAEHYSRQLGERTRDGLIQRFKDGYWTGGKPPYGYKLIDAHSDHGRGKSPRKIVINDHEAEIVRSIFDFYLSDAKGLKQTARALDGKAIAPREAAHWTHTSLRDILMNKMYVGIVKFARCRKKIDRKTGRKMMIPNDESEHLVRKDESVRIIRDEVFAQAQERLRSRSQQQNRSHLTPSTWAFTKVLICGACGKPFYASKSTAKGHVYRRYVCGTRQRLGTDCLLSEQGPDFRGANHEPGQRGFQSPVR